MCLGCPMGTGKHLPSTPWDLEWEMHIWDVLQLPLSQTDQHKDYRTPCQCCPTHEEETILVEGPYLAHENVLIWNVSC